MALYNMGVLASYSLLFQNVRSQGCNLTMSITPVRYGMIGCAFACDLFKRSHARFDVSRN